jgi:hypothetical protein
LAKRYEWNLERARCELEAITGRPVPDDHWQYLVDQDYVGELEHWNRPGTTRGQMLAQAYRGLLKSGELQAGRQPGDRRAAFRRGVPWLSADEMTLAAAIGEAMAQRARYRPDIAAAHERLNDGSVKMSAEDARRKGAEAFDDKDLETRRAFRDVARRFDWHLEDAVVFVLAGWIAPVDPITASVWITEFPDEHGAASPRSRARIVLEFDPWVSLNTVSEAYWSLRRQLIGSERKPPKAREIEAFRFVLRRLKSTGQPVENWTAIGKEWNDAHQDDGWAYSKPGDIKRAYQRIVERCINYSFPDLGTGSNEPVPASGRERGFHRRVMIDPQERVPDDLIPSGQRRRRMFRQRADLQQG